MKYNYYTYDENLYRVISSNAKLKVFGKWVDVIIYEAVKDGDTGVKYVRDKDEFHNKFKFSIYE